MSAHVAEAIIGVPAVEDEIRYEVNGLKVVTMPTQTTKTPEHFADARAAIERRLAQVIQEKTALDADLASLDALERTAAEIIARYSLASADPPTTKRSPAKAYSPEDNERILAVALAPGKDKDKFEALARDMPGRSADSLARHALDLKKIAAREQVGSETSAILEATPGTAGAAFEALKTLGGAGRSGEQARDAIQAIDRGANPLRSATRDPARPARSVTGALVDSGPGDRRVYDHPEAFTSRNSD